MISFLVWLGLSSQTLLFSHLQIQKFALRFIETKEAELFLYALKVWLILDKCSLIADVSEWQGRRCPVIFEKYSLPFSDNNTFVSLKGNLKDAGKPWELDSGHRSDISAGSKQMVHIGRPSGSRKKKYVCYLVYLVFGVLLIHNVQGLEIRRWGWDTDFSVGVCRSLKEMVNTPTSNSCSMEMPTNTDFDFEKHLGIQETMHNENSESAYPSMPPGFTSQLTDGCPSQEKGITHCQYKCRFVFYVKAEQLALIVYSKFQQGIN